MPIEKKDLNPEDGTLLTVADFFRLAAHRGKSLWLERNEKGWAWITDGRRKYVLPRLCGEWLPRTAVESLCDRFDLPHLDFALDAQDGD